MAPLSDATSYKAKRGYEAKLKKYNAVVDEMYKLVKLLDSNSATMNLLDEIRIHGDHTDPYNPYMFEAYPSFKNNTFREIVEPFKTIESFEDVDFNYFSSDPFGYFEFELITVSYYCHLAEISPKAVKSVYRKYKKLIPETV